MRRDLDRRMGGMAVAGDLMRTRNRAPCLNSEIRFHRLRYRFADFFLTSSVHFAMRAATIIPVLAVTVANGLSNQPGPPSVRVEGVCLVSPDGDFTKLAQRRREDGMEVSGFGAWGPAEAFRTTRNRFIDVEKLPEAETKGQQGSMESTGAVAAKKALPSKAR